MEENKQDDIIYSEPVNEIMGHPPGKILRWGNAIIIIVFVLFILFLWLIKYPDTIPAPVEITTVNPPVTLVSKLTGRIKNLYVRDKNEVAAGPDNCSYGDSCFNRRNEQAENNRLIRLGNPEG